jgi:hypothetical protein
MSYSLITESIATPFSVKAKGTAPPKCFLEGITFCYTTSSISISVSSYIKSPGKRSLFLRTACFNTLFLLHTIQQDEHQA